MTTLDGVTKRMAAEQAAAVEVVWLAQEQGQSLTGPDGLLEQLTKKVLETRAQWGAGRAPVSDSG
jgi:putative transposase